MTPLDRHFDVLVIGSGAAGSIAVKELAERGMDVLLLEAGRDLTPEDLSVKPNRSKGIGVGPRLKGALRGQHVQSRRSFYDASKNRFFVNDRENPYTTPRGQFFLWIHARLLGGRLNTYGRMLLRRSDLDFKPASHDGQGVDWPISYADVEPYYDRVEEFIGVYGNRDGIPVIPDGMYAGPSLLNGLEHAVQERVLARWPERRSVGWRYAAPHTGTPLGVEAALKTSRLTLRTNAVVTRITVDEQTGLADGATFVDRLTKQEERVHADVIVLCASTIESIRLLLHSASARHPQGLGNSSGALGRYFMDQTPSLAFGSDPGHMGFFENGAAGVAADAASQYGGIYFPRYSNLGENSGADFLRGFGIQAVMGRARVDTDQGAEIGMMGFGEMLPRHENHIGLNRRRKDAWGMPAPHISITMGDNDRRLLGAQVSAMRAMSEECGFRLDFLASPLGLDSRDILSDADPVSRMIFRSGVRKSLALGAAIHECGGARMGSDPAASFLNEYNQSWDVPNLFVTDASCFPSSGSVGQALTIMALTARACEHIATRLADGSVMKPA